ncbi:MAG: cation:proton antiporter [Candidatus Altiarchaeales archaeon IMC4]|nr:MAG: cation:proton antiporter [Candidatus Altiarchaeales archaeon IMC4]
MEITSMMPIYAMLASLIGGFLLLFFGKRPNVRDGISLAASVAKFAIVLSMVPIVLSGGQIVHTFFELIPDSGLEIKFKVDAFGLFFALLASFLWIITTVYAVGYMRALKEHAQTRFFFCFAISLFAALGIAFSANLLTMFVFYEILSLITYPLVIHEGNRESMRNGTKYLIYLVGTSIAFQMVAIILIYVTAGTLDFTEASGIMAESSASPLMQTVIFLLLVAGYAKAGIMPFHSWLPSAMVAPTPVSALLHAVAVVVAGVFCVLRTVFHIYGPEQMQFLGLDLILGVLVSITILVSIIFALTRDNLKARIAYSTVNQLSIMMLGAAMLTYNGMLGGVLHIASHSFAKITLFFCAGAIFVATGKKAISQLSGIGKKMPFTMLAFFIGTLGIAGAPPALGLISKVYMATGAVWADPATGEPFAMMGIGLLCVLLASALLDIICFFPIVYRAFFKELPDGESGDRQEAPLMVLVPLLITAIVTMILFFYPYAFYELAKLTVEGIGGGIR